ncbi:hypothetical protein ACVBEF_16470 [Glaciimonas sp. GG7]
MSAMFPKRSQIQFAETTVQGQGGFALITAIFLLVVLSALGVFMVTLSTVQHATSTQDVQGTRALQAARSGIDWGLYQIMLPEHTNLPAGQTPYICPTGPTPIMTLTGALTGFSLQVQCTLTSYSEAAAQIGVYQLTATSSFGVAGSSEYVERQISASISTCRMNGIPC